MTSHQDKACFRNDFSPRHTPYNGFQWNCLNEMIPMGIQEVCFDTSITTKLFVVVIVVIRTRSLQALYSIKDLNINPCPAEPGSTLPLQNSVDPDEAN